MLFLLSPGGLCYAPYVVKGLEVSLFVEKGLEAPETGRKFYSLPLLLEYLERDWAAWGLERWSWKLQESHPGG